MVLDVHTLARAHRTHPQLYMPCVRKGHAYLLCIVPVFSDDVHGVYHQSLRAQCGPQVLDLVVVTYSSGQAPILPRLAPSIPAGVPRAQRDPPLNINEPLMESPAVNSFIWLASLFACLQICASRRVLLRVCAHVCISVGAFLCIFVHTCVCVCVWG